MPAVRAHPWGDTTEHITDLQHCVLLGISHRGLMNKRLTQTHSHVIYLTGTVSQPSQVGTLERHSNSSDTLAHCLTCVQPSSHN